ncbi:hypothetical protein TRP8649_02007 [Pelagimonas phthalicica]|uniref:DUF1963 domain-containing protein n=1 Tax=Pelagimonas phthalicica TaxID=1037362 RepID=A0A238JDG7_9RHOB|nr:YwqG family protein [Pelagimonas phthalicica]TDS93583.1 uncharacterized protein YwqG [Pelagimonas phthalicica]SMX27896.1 hypothetical protein TRP8649_02007 [Pelagimonas phthalicica]
MLRTLFFSLLLSITCLASFAQVAGKSSEPAYQVIFLAWENDFDALDQYLDDLRVNQRLHENGAWLLTHAYFPFYENPQILTEESVPTIVNSVDSWRAARPNSVSALNAKAILLTRHAKSLPEDSSNRQDAVTKALEFMANHAEIGDQDPHWRATQLELLALQTVPIPNFEARFAEELSQNPGFAPLQRSAASYLARHEPKKLSEFVLTADERFTGMTSRLFSHILHDLPRPSEADWSKIRTSYLSVMDEFPNAWNQQALAKAACTVGDFELAAKHIEKLPWLDVLWVWGTPDVPQTCRDEIIAREIWTCEESRSSQCLAQPESFSWFESFLVMAVGCFAATYVSVSLWSWYKLRNAPRITQDEIDALKQAQDQSRLPRVRIENTALPPADNVQSRLGGAPTADETHRHWPVTEETGMPMLFLAQINFSETQPLPDFPDSGILQLFAGIETDGRLVFTEDPGSFELRYLPNPEADDTMALPFQLENVPKHSALSKEALLEGRALRFEADTAIASIHHSSLDRFRQDWHNRLPESDDIGAQLEAFEKAEELESAAAPTHWVGGHPDFVQEDVRFDPDWQEMDRVLLHLGFDDDLCLGDAGMLNVMITQEDLRNRAFDKAICTWDCS